MRLFTLERRQHLSIAIETAWDFFSNPRNLPLITPDWLDLTITNRIAPKMHAGMIIHYRLKTIWGLPAKWITEITHVAEPVYFVDEMRSGPYRFWHHQHHFVQTADGVAILDHVNYALKLGWFGQILHNMVIRNRLNEIFNYRQKALETLF
jgi:ligand-binding SRPBCC domain-containing protein